MATCTRGKCWCSRVPLAQVGQCPQQLPMNRDPLNEEPQTVPDDIIDLYVAGQDTDFTPSSSKELSKQVAKLISEVDEKDKTICQLKGTVNKMADAAAQRERHARRHQAKLEDQARQHKKEQERLHARIVALQSKLEACRRQLSKKDPEIQTMHCHIQNDCGKYNARITGQQVSLLPSTSGSNNSKANRTKGGSMAMTRPWIPNVGKQSRNDNKEEKEDKRPKPSRKWKDYEHCT